MPPNIALLLSIIFIFIVFRIDSKQKPGVSFTLWVPLIWIMLFASRVVSYWLESDTDIVRDVDYLSGSPIDRAIFSVLTVIGVFILFKRKVDWSHILKSNAPIILLFLYMGFSVIWSDFQGVSFKRWIRTIGVLVMVLVVLTESNPLEAISRLFRRFSFILLPLSIVLIRYFPNIGRTWDSTGDVEYWLGVASHKNGLGLVCMISGIYFIWNIMRTWGSKKVFIDILFLFMTLYLLKGSSLGQAIRISSVTSEFALIIGIGTLLMLRFTRINLKYVGTTIFFVVLIFFLVFLVVENLIVQDSLISLVIESSGRDMTFTGRTELWADLIEIGSRHPILGVGYGSFWIGDVGNDLWEKYIWHPGQGHNGYIDVYVELGLAGLFLLLVVIFFAFRNVVRTFAFDFEYVKFRMVLLIMMLAHNFTESSFTKSYSLLWFVFLLSAVHIPRVDRNRQKAM